MTWRSGLLPDDPFSRGMADAEWRANGNIVEDKPAYSDSENAKYAAGAAQFRHMRRVFGD